MMLRLQYLRVHPSIFRNLTGITVSIFDQLLGELCPAFAAARRQRLERRDRQRAFGGGDDFDLPAEDQFLLTIFWLRHYPTQEVLGYLFGVSDSSAKRALDHCLPLLEAAGTDTMRLPDRGRGRRKELSTLLKDTPDVAVIIDTFEQAVPRPRRRQQRYYSGKKKRHALKSQVAVDELTGHIVDVAPSRPGPVADIKVLENSKLLAGWHVKGWAPPNETLRRKAYHGATAARSPREQSECSMARRFPKPPAAHVSTPASPDDRPQTPAIQGMGCGKQRYPGLRREQVPARLRDRAHLLQERPQQSARGPPSRRATPQRTVDGQHPACASTPPARQAAGYAQPADLQTPEVARPRPGGPHAAGPRAGRFRRAGLHASAQAYRGAASSPRPAGQRRRGRML